MIIVISKNESKNYKLPVKFWVDYNTLEWSAVEQIIHLSNLPFAFHHIAIMPDCHTGYGMPIGGVLATEGVVVPNAVGVDVGCGLVAVKTSLKAEQLDKDTLKKIMGKIREVVPVGFEHHKEKQDIDLMPNSDELNHNKFIVFKEYDSALKQLGTLGGGNHFIEIQKDTDNNIWIMIHSGSRNLGYKVAKYYNDLAIELNTEWFSQVPKKWELAFLPIDTKEAKNYMIEMQYCVDFALANRKLMMERILDIFNGEDFINCYMNKNSIKYGSDTKDRISFAPIINIAHNYAQFENHFGQNVIVHRKGATLAREGTIGIIPGSQGTKSYIVKGLGNADSFKSCSHGAGRKMGRKQATLNLNLEEEIRKMEEQGIIHGLRTTKDLDEASGAYKDISEVISQQLDLIEVICELTPLGVIKG